MVASGDDSAEPAEVSVAAAWRLLGERLLELALADGATGDSDAVAGTSSGSFLM
jgi:hypothetical protein